MFPWSPEFSWDAGHVIFLGAFYSVVLVVVSVLGLAIGRARRAAPQAEAIAWHADFEDLPPAARACRHQLTGEAPDRACDNGFDCRTCATHPALLARRAPGAAATADTFGFRMPADRYYHRGHTFARPEADGTVTIGLDDIGRRLVGVPDRLELPELGARLTVNGVAARLTTRGSAVRILSPVEGEVVEARSDGPGFRLRVRPGGPLDTRHLLAGDEVRPWVLREIERLERVLGSPDGSGIVLADGGEPLEDFGPALPRDRHDAVLGEMFLEP